jgi:peptide/nickel transport system permease protein
MSPVLKFVIRRLALIPVSLLVITALLYAIAMLSPVDARAQLYLPRNLSRRVTEKQLEIMKQDIIKRYGLDQPYPVQYLNWLGSLLQGEWGWSPNARANVLDYLTPRAPATVELTLYALLLFIPMGMLSGVIASQRHNRALDHGFRLTAFTATSIPPFILGLMMISVLYAGLQWFAPERLSQPLATFVRSSAFQSYTGLYTIDGLLNGRPDVTLDALKHLVMPVLTLSALHWATLGRVTRASMIEELDKEYIVAAEARGVPPRSIVWRHALRNALVPALTSSALSAASLISGVYVVEIIFNMHGVSEMLTLAAAYGPPDVAAALGFAVFSVTGVLLVMFVLDIIQALVDPRLRERLGS